MAVCPKVRSKVVRISQMSGLSSTIRTAGLTPVGGIRLIVAPIRSAATKKHSLLKFVTVIASVSQRGGMIGISNGRRENEHRAARRVGGRLPERFPAPLPHPASHGGR